MGAEERSPSARRRLVEGAFEHAVRAMQPGVAVERILSPAGRGFSVGERQVDVEGRLLLIAFGKAAPAMATAAANVLGDRIDAGIVLTKDGHLTELPDGFEGFEAAHPVPDERGITASRKILSLLTGLERQDVVLALISGGGSALLEAPREGVELADIQRVTDLLLRAGAPIQDLNRVRSELSQVKGGGLRRWIGEARTVSLVLSDVLGNDPEIIASGPTIVREAQPERALEIIDHYHLTDRVPDSVIASLRQDAESSTSITAADGDIFELVGDNTQLVDAVGSWLADQGLSVKRLWRDAEGEARDRGEQWVTEAAGADADAVIGGGELTVTVRGDGVGGRNTEFVVAAAKVLPAVASSLTIASLASDGQDGSADAAGGVVDETSLAAMTEQGIDVDRVLADNDSATALGTIGALVSPGPTGTNVNDVYIAIRGTSRNAT